MNKDFTEWDDFEKELNISSRQETEIQLEMEIIKATVEARKKSNLSQRDLSKISGIKQPAIARIESLRGSPRIATIMTILNSMGYTLKVVPLNKTKKQ